MKPGIPILALALASLFLTVPSAKGAEVRVENFALIDHLGKFHEFDYYRRDEGVKAIVLFIQGNGCPLVRKRIPELRRLRDEFQPKGVLFGMLNANPQDEREDIREEAQDFEIDMPILKDDRQLAAGMLQVERTGEALLIDPKTRRVVYRGPIDDRLTYQKEKAEASEHYLNDAIQAFLSGAEIAPVRIEAPGCLITMEGPDEKVISYREDVAPILKQRCVECHSEGGAGPFAMSSYRKVKGWSEMMAEMILTRQMPPWHADPHIGHFSNSSGLSDEEARTLVSWIRNGTPRGEGDDPLAEDRPERTEWILGEPDAVIDFPKQEIPAEGILEYRYAYIDSPFDHDVWLSASEINPGNRRVLHHAIVGSEKQSAKRKRGISGSWVTGYAPGTDPLPYPEGTGVLFRKGDRLKVEIHYTVTGRAEEDQTRIGLHLLDSPPAKRLETSALSHHRFKIPPHDREFAQSVVKKIDGNVLLYGINPHMHFRGKRMRFTLKSPDGSERVLLSVPNYNFNWQRTYQFETPIPVVAGSEIVVDNAWDNSVLNLHNPDPSKTVGWGDQTFDEMFFATFTYVTTD